MKLTFTSRLSSALSNGETTYLITGATGWLGRALAEMLHQSLGERFPERVILCGSKAQSMQLEDGTTLPVHALPGATALAGTRPTWLFHLAFLTKDRVGTLSDEEYIARNREISQEVVALIASGAVSGVMLASSGAVYDHLHGGTREAAANLYGMLKAEDELRFGEACGRHGVKLVQPRIFNLSGPYMNKFGAYALSSIINDVLQGGPIRLRADKRVLRSYFYIGDLFELCMRCLADEFPADAAIKFDTVGTDVVEVGQLAERIRFLLGRPLVPIERPALRAGVEDRYIGDAEALTSLMARYDMKPLPLDEQIVRTADYLQQQVAC